MKKIVSRDFSGKIRGCLFSRRNGGRAEDCAGEHYRRMRTATQTRAGQQVKHERRVSGNEKGEAGR